MHIVWFGDTVLNWRLKNVHLSFTAFTHKWPKMRNLWAIFMSYLMRISHELHQRHNPKKKVHLVQSWRALFFSWHQKSFEKKNHFLTLLGCYPTSVFFSLKYAVEWKQWGLIMSILHWISVQCVVRLCSPLSWSLNWSLTYSTEGQRSLG